MRTFGLIGFPLDHSFSQAFFTEKFFRENIRDAEFRNFPLEQINQFPALVEKEKSLCGLNVTRPWKEAVIQCLHTLDSAASATGAVNCIAFHKGKFTGYNTDVFGFTESLKPLLEAHHQQALILGSGGASKAVQFGLKQLGIGYQVVSRKAVGNQLDYAMLNEDWLQSHRLIINTTPLGQPPQAHLSPDIPWQFVTAEHLLFDLVYHPEPTLFLLRGQQRGAQVKGGMEMLWLQAEKSWEIWNP
jgi:shikimate dehydrogenase